MGRRRQARELALQSLYMTDTSKVGDGEALRMVAAGLEDRDEKMIAFADSIFKGAVENLAAIDEKLKKHATNWALERMASVDRNILRLAAYELLYCEETPVSVVIDEAIEIAKKFGTDESGRFINGVLDKLKKYRKDAAPAKKKPAKKTKKA